MKVALEKHGGWTATMRCPPQIVEAAALPKAAAEELTRLVAAAQAAPAGVEDERARDAMSYTVTVEDGGRPIVLRQSDTTMSAAFADLLAWLERHFPAK